jgi:hypothetical protein
MAKITGLVGGIRDFETMIKIGFKYIEYLKQEFSKLDSNAQFIQEVDISEDDVATMIKKIRPSYDKTWERFLESFRVLKNSGIISAPDNDEFKKRHIEKHQKTGYTIHIHHVCLSLLKSFNNEKDFTTYILENFKNAFGCKIFEKIKDIASEKRTLTAKVLMDILIKREFAEDYLAYQKKEDKELTDSIKIITKKLSIQPNNQTLIDKKKELQEKHLKNSDFFSNKINELEKVLKELERFDLLFSIEHLDTQKNEIIHVYYSTKQKNNNEGNLEESKFGTNMNQLNIGTIYHAHDSNSQTKKDYTLYNKTKPENKIAVSFKLAKMAHGLGLENIYQNMQDYQNALNNDMFSIIHHVLYGHETFDKNKFFLCYPKNNDYEFLSYIKMIENLKARALTHHEGHILVDGIKFITLSKRSSKNSKGKDFPYELKLNNLENIFQSTGIAKNSKEIKKILK